MERDAALELLRDQHEFPGPFQFRVVVRPDKIGVTVSAMVAAAGDQASLLDVGERRSSKGNYVALQVRMHLPEAERVLDVYAVVREMDHVLASL